MGKLSQLRRADASPGLVLFIVCAAVVLASLDLFIVNVALPDMAQDLGEDNLGDLSWVLNAYAITYAALLLLFGRMAERHRRDLGFLLGVATFIAASAACAAASSLGALIAFRVLQAAGAALLTPTSLSLVLATTAPEKRQTAVRIWTAVGGAAAALGPVIGGLLVAASWRWVFLVNVPIGLVALVVGWRRLPRVPGHDVPHPDALGALLGTVGIGALTLGLVKGEDWGWGAASTVAALTVAVVTLGLFVLHTMRAENPLVDPTLFRGRAFRGASLAMVLFSVAFGAMLLSIVLWMQVIWGWSALKSGLAIAPGPLMVPLFGLLLAGRLIARFGAGPVAGTGAAVFALGFVWWAVGVGGVGDRRGARLRRRDARRDGRRGHRRRPDAPDADGDGRRLAPAAVLRHRLRGDQHPAPGRARDRRRRARRAARLTARPRELPEVLVGPCRPVVGRLRAGRRAARRAAE